MQITRHALVSHAAMDMFQLVRDVPSYPQFLSWCTGAEVHEETADMQLATLAVRLGGIRQTFTTRNIMVAGERLSMNLVDGPFRALEGEWRFTALGEAGSKVSLSMAFEMSASLVSAAFQRGFAGIADRMVKDFCRRADALYAGSEHG